MALNAITHNNENEPTLKQAIANNPEREHWIQAIKDEHQSWQLLNVYDECEELPHNRQAINCRILLKHKTGAHNQIIKYKACAVAVGYQLVQGIDYLDSFSAMAIPSHL